jgi:acyl carrier protein
MKVEIVQSKVFDIIQEILCDRRSLLLSDRLVGDLRIDSDDLSFSLVPDIEQAFSIRVPIEEWGHVYTIEDVVNLVQRHLQASGSG